MVQFHFTKSGNLLTEKETIPFPVKLEVPVEEDLLDDEHGPYNKRFKLENNQEYSAGLNAYPVPPSQYNPFAEPSPLGLRLRKSPSLLDLIQMRLSKGNTSTFVTAPTESNPGHKKEGEAGSSNSDRRKASNFPAILLRIGDWEYVSKYEGDLVAKCYFAKHKLVWEVLESGLKSKIEIQWSDIMGLDADCPDEGVGTLKVVLSRQPFFFRETNPQPRKHTLWQPTSDFTNGQASIQRLHLLQCPQGLLNKHFENLIQCDMRLSFLSQHPEIVLDSPYFDKRGSVFEAPEESRLHGFDAQEIGKASTSSGSCYQDASSSCAIQLSSLKIEKQDSVGGLPDYSSLQVPSPSSAEGGRTSEASDLKEAKTRNWEQLKIPGFHPSMSMSDFMNHIEQHLCEQMPSVDSTSSDVVDTKKALEEMAQYLLSDSQYSSASDEKTLMSRVNSLCCLLQDPVTAQDLQADEEIQHDVPNGESQNDKEIVGNIVPDHSDDSKQDPGMLRKDSTIDLLLHLPRIASLPKLLADVSEDGYIGSI